MKNRFQRSSKAGPAARFFCAGLLIALLVTSGCGGKSKAKTKAKAKAEAEADPIEVTPLERELSERIHACISRTSESESGEFADYEIPFPKAPGSPLSMVAIPAGEFTMGSPAGEPGRRPDEGPAHRVRVSAFWMGRHEVSWDLFSLYIGESRRSGEPMPDVEAFANADDCDLADWVSGPTTSYMEMSFGMGKAGFPAICMTQHAASKFCQWLSARTGHYYRLPTEAEWEYACRAGSATAYHFGDSPDRLGEFDHFDPAQTNTGYRKVIEGEPNPRGLFNMHGNVLEWCLDEYAPDVYAKRWKAGGVIVDPLEMPVHRYPRVARGGSWYDTADYCRSAARTFSNPDWITQDPTLPNSLWWHTDAPWLGFRVVRPLKIPNADVMHDLWNSGDVHRDPKRKMPPKLP